MTKIFSPQQWRIAVPFIIFSLIVMGGLAAVLARPECAADSTCLSRAVWTTAGLLAVGTAALALFQAR